MALLFQMVGACVPDNTGFSSNNIPTSTYSVLPSLHICLKKYRIYSSKIILPQIIPFWIKKTGQYQSNGMHIGVHLGPTGRGVLVSYKRRETGEGFTFRERKRNRVSGTECGGKFSVSSLHHHMERFHGRVLPPTRGVDVGGGGLETYVVSFQNILKLVEFPVEVFPVRANNPRRLREHFM